MAKYFKDPFAVAGDVTSIPNDVQPDGSVSYTQGWGIDYSKDPEVDPDAKQVPRAQTNQFYNDVTVALQQYQQHGVPDFITSADNGGTPYTYGKYDIVRYDPGTGMQVYQSVIDANTDLPTVTASWSPVPLGSPPQLTYAGGTSTGSANAQAFASVTPSGFTLQNGVTVTGTIGFTNTGSATMNVVSTGNIVIKKNSGGGLVVLSGSEMTAGNQGSWTYNAGGTCWVFESGGNFLKVASNLADVANPSASLANIGGAPLVSPGFSGVPTGPTPGGGDNSTTIPNTTWVQGELAAKAPLASPALTGVPTVPTAAAGTSTTQAASTAFVKNTSASVQGAHKNLSIANSVGTPNSIMQIQADSIALANTGGGFLLATSVNVSPNVTASGANGLDTGSVAANTWYSEWVIGKADGTIAGLFSTSATAPTMPSGYTFKARVGYARTDAAGHFLRIKQIGRVVQYVVTNGTTSDHFPTMASGLSGSVSVPTWTAVSTGSFVPPTAGIIRVILLNDDGEDACVAAPNNNYGVGGVSRPPMENYYGSFFCEMVLESSNIYYASAATLGVMSCFGWEDNL